MKTPFSRTMAAPLSILFPVTLLAFSAPGFAAADAAQGKRLHDKQCLSCHVKQYGGDGSEMYQRMDRRIHDRSALGQRVASCNAMVNAGLFPEEEEDIAAYLDKQFYKFDKKSSK